MGADVAGAVSLYRNDRGVDEGGAGAAAVAGLWTDADGRGKFTASFGRERTIHAARVHGHVRGAVGSVFVLDLPRSAAGAGRRRVPRRAIACDRRELKRGNETTTLWFSIVAVMFAIYAVLDRFDIGVGIVYLLAARTDAERPTLQRSIGPVSD